MAHAGRDNWGKEYDLMRALHVLVLITGSAFLCADEEEVQIPKPSVEVQVEASRLSGHSVDAAEVPIASFVITREEIDRSAATTVPEILAEYPEIVSFDMGNNGKELSVDLRGFNEGTAAAVFLDDVRINEPDDNRTLLSQIPLEWVRRIEITKGASSSVLGGGALSGAIRIYTNRDTEGTGFRLATGSYSSGRVTGEHNQSTSVGKLSVGAGYDRSDGFRENGESRQEWFRTGFRRPVGAGSLDLAYSYTSSRFGLPCALTADELEQDRHASPYNKVDEDAFKTHLFSADFRMTHKSMLFTGNAFLRSNGADALTTGRYADLYGGFATEARNTSGGATLQIMNPIVNDQTNLTAGAELTWVQLDADGFYTDAAGQRTGEASSTKTSENWQAAFAQIETSLADRVNLFVSGRYDRQSMDFDDILSKYAAARTFDRGTFKAGTSLSWDPHSVSFVSYSTAFQTPTILDLFAYPLFGSNPDLRPSFARTLEIGHRYNQKFVAFEISVFGMRVTDEVVYVMTDPIHFIGRNENAGRSLRKGLDLSFAAHPRDGTTLQSRFAYIDARFDTGQYDGNDLAMVPNVKCSFGITQDLTPQLRVGGQILYTGSQHVMSDDANAQPKLDAYWRADMRVRYSRQRWAVEGAIRNLTNNKYSTRAITDGFMTYFAPAPGINADVSFSCRF